MTQLSKSLMCILMRSGVEIWMEEDKAKKLSSVLGSPDCPRFINYSERTFNTADITGIYKASDMEDMTRRKNGEVKCKHGKWHDRFEKCQCTTYNTKAAEEFNPYTA